MITTEKIEELRVQALKTPIDYRMLVKRQELLALLDLAQRAMVSQPQGQALPELPDVTFLGGDPDYGDDVYGFTANQMGAYGRQCYDAAYASQLALPAGPVPTDAEFDALRGAAIEACTWLDHANCVDLPVDDDDPDTSMRASMNKLRDLAWKVSRRSASPEEEGKSPRHKAFGMWSDIKQDSVELQKELRSDWD